jgi:transposase
MRVPPWVVSDGLWLRLEPLLPRRQRRFRYPGRKPLDDRLVLQAILFVLHTGIAWEHLPQELGFGCGMTAWRRLRAWQETGVWERLHELLLAELHAAGELDWSRAIADSSHVQAKKGARRPVPARLTAVGAAASTTYSWKPAASRSRGRSRAATATM